jgi:hypothetical protein
MARDTTSIDDRVRASLVPKQPEHGAIAQWWKPWLAEYDVYKNARELITEPVLRDLGITEGEAAYYLQEAYNQHHELYDHAGSADTLDKYRVPLVKVAAGALTAAGVTAPIGVPLYIGMQVLEWKYKLPMIRALRKDSLPANRQLGKNLFVWEFASLIPLLGEVMDFMNHYVAAAEKAITNHGRHNIYEAHREELEARYRPTERQYRTIDTTAKEVRQDTESLA